jgi:3-deoxy-D-manno-octulosonic-acid transferase
MWILYQLAVALVLLLAGPILLLLRGKHYLPTLPGRLGLGRPSALRSPLWIHAVSFGEAGVARTLIGGLPDTEQIVVSTITPTGQALAAALDRPRYETAYLPFELGWPIRRFLGRFAPRALVLCEGDYWPLLLRHVRRRGLRVAVVNGRVSDRSYGRMRRLRPLLGPLLGPVEIFGVQTEDDRDRLLELGVDAERVHVTGNVKFDAEEPARDPDLERRLTGLAAGRPILIAGSTMVDEEASVLAGFQGAGGGTSALLVLAPRHPERWSSVAELATAQGFRLVRRSELDPAATDSHDPPDIVLLDSMGELAGLYAICRSAFIGGTLVSTGGHNPLEPARFGVAIVAGPSMENFRAMGEQFDRARAWQRVDDADSLARLWRAWIEDPAGAETVGRRASELVERNRGAVDRTLALISPVLDAAGDTL